MQTTIELDQPREASWIRPAAWCLMGIFFAALSGAVAGWLDWRLTGGHFHITLINVMALVVVSVLATALALNQARMRNGRVGLAVALAIILAFQGCSELVGYGMMRQAMLGTVRQTAAEHGVTVTEAEMNQAIDEFLQNELGAPGLAGFAVYRGRGDGALLFIRLLVGGLAALLTWGTVYSRPFCPACGGWYGRPVYIGALATEDYEAFVRWIALGDLRSAAQMLRQDLSAYPRVMVYTITCKNSAAHDSLLTTSLYKIPAGTSRPQHTRLLTTQLSPAQYGDLKWGLGVPGAVVDSSARVISEYPADLQK